MKTYDSSLNKKETPINRGFSSDSYILLDSKMNMLIAFGRLFILIVQVAPICNWNYHCIKYQFCQIISVIIKKRIIIIASQLVYFVCCNGKKLSALSKLLSLYIMIWNINHKAHNMRYLIEVTFLKK